MSQHHAYSVEYAVLYGTECATLIHHFQFWIEHNQAMGRNFHDDRTWTYQTQKEIAAYYPYWTESQIKRIINKLVDCGVLIRGNYNQTPFDRTVWYAFENEKMFTKRRNRLMDETEVSNGPAEIVSPIPYTNPYSKEDNTIRPPKKEVKLPPTATATSASPVVVSSDFFSLIKISDSLRHKLMLENPIEKLQVAAKRCLAWKGRESDTTGILSVLKRFDEWEDIVSEEDTTKSNKTFLETLKKLDYVKIGDVQIEVSYKDMTITRGCAIEIFETSDKEFVNKVKAKLKTLGIEA